jgi:hypothetical protein
MTDPFAPNSGWGNYALAGITEITLPEAVDLWPQTVGWWLLLIAVTWWLAKRSYSSIKRYWRNRYRRVALQQLKQVQQQVAAGDCSLISKIPEIIKATALHSFPRSNVAELFGKEWERFLDQCYSGPSFELEFPGQFYTLSYQPNNLDTALLTDQFWLQCQQWISTHRSAYD